MAPEPKTGNARGKGDETAKPSARENPTLRKTTTKPQLLTKNCNTLTGNKPKKPSKTTTNKRDRNRQTAKPSARENPKLRTKTDKKTSATEQDMQHIWHNREVDKPSKHN